MRPCVRARVLKGKLFHLEPLVSLSYIMRESAQMVDVFATRFYVCISV